MHLRAILFGLLAAMALAPVPGAPAPGGTLILDEGCYFRRYYRFGMNRYSPAAMRAEGEQVLGRAGLDRVRRDTEAAWAKGGLAPAQMGDWRDHVLQPMWQNFQPAPAPVPPEDWAGPAFDDGAWVRARGPFQGPGVARITDPALGQFTEAEMDLGLLTAYYRARFLVDDPGAAGPLTLRLVYSGGARVLVNGQEVARGHLPAGALAPETPAEEYPLPAYQPGGEAQRDRTIGPVQIPARLLRKGANVLAVEVRGSDFHPVVLTNPRQVNWGGPTRPWPHARLARLELRGSGVRPATARPAGVQVWAEDPNRRVESSDFLPPGEGTGGIRLVAPGGGTCAAQVVVGTQSPIAWPRITVSALKQDAGTASLPGTAVRVWYGMPFPRDEWNLQRMGDERGLNASFPTNAELFEHAKMAPGKAYLFDRLSPTPPAGIPANACRPAWLSVQVPADALPGRYQGTVTVAVPGAPPVPIPLELEVAWRLPRPQEYRTLVGCEENPYAVAQQYGVALWSDEHFALLEASFRQLARIGNRWVNVPVIVSTEFGNRDDSPIRWIRRRDRSLAFDYTVMDRTLDLATKHCGPPKVVQFVVMHGMKSPLTPPMPPYVMVRDDATGTATALAMGTPQTPPAEVRAAWQAFARSLYEHMKARGQEKAMVWGAPLEAEAQPELKEILAEAVPDVSWTAGPHEMMANGTYAKNERFYRLINTIRYHQGWPAFVTERGWKSKTTHLLNPRVGGTVFALHTTSHPFAYRVMPQHALAFGRSGFTRVGADEWAAAHFQGMALPRWLTGVPVLFLLWPGPAGAETSARFECLIEGIQETEARITLEQALERGGLQGDLGARIRKALDEDLAETKFFKGNSIIHAFEEYHYRWRERTARLYRLAAEVAGA